MEALEDKDHRLASAHRELLKADSVHKALKDSVLVVQEAWVVLVSLIWQECLEVHSRMC